MKNPHRRKKNPEQVRQQLLDGAATLAIERGWSAVSIEAVASAAGVTKGGLFHHFANKQALLQAVFDHLIDAFAKAIAEKMDADPEPYGRFTRAYVDLAFTEDDTDDVWNALWSSGEGTSLGETWGRWLSEQLAIHAATDGDVKLEAVRFAADGIWAAHVSRVKPRDAHALRDHLIAMTRPG